MVLVVSHTSGQRRTWCIHSNGSTGEEVLAALRQREGAVQDVVLQCHGQVIYPSTCIPPEATVVATLRLPGGKGGFGSMLRAIGAQIEKTTNREACRDLSGRRLRDINEERRLKDFITKKAEREQELLERKRQKFKMLQESPRHIFQDDSYFQQRELREKNLYDSLDKAFQAKNGSIPSDSKRKLEKQEEEPVTKPKKGKFLDDLDESSDEASECDDETVGGEAEGNNSEGNNRQTEGEASSNSNEDNNGQTKTEGTSSTSTEGNRRETETEENSGSTSNGNSRQAETKEGYRTTS